MRADKTGYAFNQTRQTFLATRLHVADTHWRRLVGLLGTSKRQFQSGAGLWIVPCHGVHTLAMRYPIDVLYLDRDNRVLLVEHSVRPWRMTPVLVDAATVIELPAHTAWSTSTKEGDQVEIKVGREATPDKEPSQNKDAPQDQDKEAQNDAGSLRAS